MLDHLKKTFRKCLLQIYNKTKLNGVRVFNNEDKKVLQKIKQEVLKIPKLELPLDTDHLIIETDGSGTGWGAVLLCKPTEFSYKNTEKICRYVSGSYKERGHISTIDSEILAILTGI